MIKNYYLFRGRTTASKEKEALSSLLSKKLWQVGFLAIFFFVFTTLKVNAQANSYGFAQTNETYVPITGGTVIVTSTAGTPNLDSYVSTVQTMPSFTFAGVAYTSFFVTSNGLLSFGATAPSGTNYAVMSSSSGGNALLAPFSGDLDDNTGVSEIRSETVGSEFVVQWKNFRRYNRAESFNFQIRMNLTDNSVKFVYDGTPPYDVSTSYQPQVGIKSAVGIYNYLTVPTGGSWNTPVSSVSGVSASSLCTFTGATGFTSGLTYTWVALSCLPVTALVPSNIALNSATVSWTAPATAPASGYEYEVRTSGGAGSGATGLVTSGTTTTLTQDLTSLNPSTIYFVYVRSNCGASNYSVWFSVSFSTLCNTSAIPYVVPIEDVNIPAIPQCTAVQNVNADTQTWKSNAAVGGITGKVMAYTYSGTAAANDWFFTRSLNLTAGVSYRLKFKYKDTAFPEKLKVGIGASALNSAMTTTLFDVTTGVAGATVLKEIDFTVATTGEYTIGFQCYSVANQNVLYLGEISVITTPTDAVDFGNLQAFVANNTAVTSIETCQLVQVYAQAYEPGLTEAAGQGAGLTAFVGYSTTNTDPATWPESAWTAATFNANVGNNDEFSVTYPVFVAGNYYFASRFQLNGGPYKYGASNNGFWNTTTNPNATLGVTAPVLVTATAATPTFCAGGSTSITAASTNENYTYLWSNGGTTATINVTPTATTTYTVTATNPATGCTATANVTVNVNAVPGAVVLTPDTASVCEGQSVAIVAATAAVDSTIQYGTATTATTTTTGTPFPNPFSAWYGGVKNQMLYTQAELTAQGLISGSMIKSVSFDIAAFVANKTCNDFTIRIGSTSVATLTAFVPLASLTTVYNTTFTPSATGFVTFVFTTPFTWDGTSNIVVETVHNSGNSGNGSGTTVRYSTTPFVSCFYGAKDSTTPAGVASFDALTSWPNTGSNSNRPNVKFLATKLPAVTWLPVANLFTDTAATVPYVAGASAMTVYAKPNANVTYTATATIGTCTTSDDAVITVNGLPNIPTGDAIQDGLTISELVVAPATGITWYPTEADAIAGTNPLLTTDATVDGSIYYAVNTSGTCRSAAFAVTINHNLSTDGFNLKSLKYYPNPVNNILTVSYGQEITGLKLYNMVGQQLMNKKVNATETQLDMSNLPAGSYLLEVTSGAQSKMVKLLKNQ